MGVPLSVTINGTNYQSEVDDRTLLVQYIREELRLTGTHIGCDTSSCGACTILVDGKAVKSCTILAASAHGAEITTIEGLAENGELHPIQESFKEQHGLQCGFCTPGMIMTAVQLLEDNAQPSEAEIRKGLEGNYCRCTGYHNIVKAIYHASRKQKEVSHG